MGEFADLTGQTLTKLPGEVDGGEFTVRGLRDCAVYLLDFTSSIDISDCSNCKLFFGPVDGGAIFKNCTGCQVAVVAKVFKAHECEDCEFSLYSSNRPHIENCQALRFSVYMGAYPGLSQHMTESEMDPKQNLWDQIQESNDAGGEPSFSFVDAEEYWEVPVEGAGPCDNPIPGPGGRAYRPGQQQPGGGSAPHHEVSGGGHPPGGGGAPLDAGVFSQTFSGQSENGDAPLSAFPRENGGAPITPVANSKLAEVQKAVRARLATQEKEEQEGKAATLRKAEAFLAKFYKGQEALKMNALSQERVAKMDAKKKQNREAEKAAKVTGPEGEGHWERAISLIDFSNPRPAGSDLSRLKSVLFAAKGRDAKAGGTPLKAGGA